MSTRFDPVLRELKEAHECVARARRLLKNEELYERLSTLDFFDYNEVMQHVGSVERALRTAHDALK